MMLVDESNLFIRETRKRDEILFFSSQWHNIINIPDNEDDVHKKIINIYQSQPFSQYTRVIFSNFFILWIVIEKFTRLSWENNGKIPSILSGCYCLH